jgi:hypothetical protein
MFVNGSGQNGQSLERTFHRCPLKPLVQMNRNLVGSIYGRSSIKTAHFVPIGLQTWPSQAILVSDWLISKKEIFSALSEVKIFFNLPIRNKNCLWRPCLLTDRAKMCKLYRGPSIDASYQVSVHLAKGVSEEKIKRSSCF